MEHTPPKHALSAPRPQAHTPAAPSTRSSIPHRRTPVSRLLRLYLAPYTQGPMVPRPLSPFPHHDLPPSRRRVIHITPIHSIAELHFRQPQPRTSATPVTTYTVRRRLTNSQHAKFGTVPFFGVRALVLLRRQSTNRSSASSYNNTETGTVRRARGASDSFNGEWRVPSYTWRNSRRIARRGWRIWVGRVDRGQFLYRLRYRCRGRLS